LANTRVKICGITRPEDARLAADSGADAIGLVFYGASPRNVSVAQALEVVAAVTPLVTVVGLFVNESAALIERILQQVPLGMLQFHGDESGEFCRQFNRPWMKALRVRPDMDLVAACTDYDGASAVLLDAWQEGVPGGTGKTFDWSLVHETLPLPLVLAGGLNAGNVARAMAQLRPAAVDVSGGVESSPGRKDAGKISQFIAAVRAADTQLSGAQDDQ
jgi:phosphoribosylanthranilate isomerase